MTGLQDRLVGLMDAVLRAIEPFDGATDMPIGVRGPRECGDPVGTFHPWGGTGAGEPSVGWGWCWVSFS